MNLITVPSRNMPISTRIIIMAPKVSKKLPGALIAIIAVTAGSYILGETFDWYSVETIGDRFGTMATDIPNWAMILYTITINAPVGPPIWTVLPPKNDTMNPPIMAVISPIVGLTPDAIPKAIARGRATMPTTSLVPKGEVCRAG